MKTTLEEYEAWVKEKLDPLLTNKKGEIEGCIVNEEKIEALVNAKLKETLGNRQVEYISADWKNVEELVDAILTTEFDILRASKKVFQPFEEIEGGHGSSDDYVLIAISGEADDDELDIVFDLMHNLGADIPELQELPEPRCPKCGKKVEVLLGGYPAVVPAKAIIIDGELYIDAIKDYKTCDVIMDDPPTWHCPECDAELFTADQEDEMTKFLKGK